MFCPPKIEMFREPRAAQDISGFALGGSELLNLLSMFDPYGAWRLDIESGLAYWTHDIFEIHEMEPRAGPINLTEALNCYYPEDRIRLAGAIADVIEKKSGYRAIVRVACRKNGYRFVKTIGRYRTNPEGREEIIGIYTRVPYPEPAIALVE